MEQFLRYSEAQVYGCLCENYIDEIDGQIMRTDFVSVRIPTVRKQVMRNYVLWFSLNA